MAVNSPSPNQNVLESNFCYYCVNIFHIFQPSVTVHPVLISDVFFSKLSV